jgi:hemoglobin
MVFHVFTVCTGCICHSVWDIYVGETLARERSNGELIRRAFVLAREAPTYYPKGEHTMSNKTLYERLGGYDAICAVSEDLLPRLMSDSRLKRFWDHRGEDGLNREKQLLIDFLCSSAGGPMYYTGRDMKISHKGMKISEADWTAFFGHLNATPGCL